MDFPFAKRINKIKSGNESGKYILYWMQGAFRCHHNHSLEFSIWLANQTNKPLLVLAVVDPSFPKANFRSYKFFLEGLKDVMVDLSQRNIAFQIEVGNFLKIVPKYAESTFFLIVDKAYLPDMRRIRRKVYERVGSTIFEVDTNLLVPVDITSDRKEIAARTIRPKILRLSEAFLNDFEWFEYEGPRIEVNDRMNLQNIETILNDLQVEYVPPCSMIGGHSEAVKKLDRFIQEKFHNYAKYRNDPGQDVESKLSAYLHFGHISAQEILKRLKQTNDVENYEAFFEQLVVRRELAHNFAYHVEDLDDLYSLIPSWAVKTLVQHAEDEREYLYELEQFEKAQTHDEVWNSAQRQLLETGKIHNYLRMYWGKKIIEWTSSPKKAYQIMVYLNDKYALDGRDPNGYVGILWCFGLHDRPFKERKIFGKVRYMGLGKIKRR
ncbi:deoxyribodipyrimidine photo-lyase [Pseudothermotoga sp.]|uniref:deoxyribodipyrimidine photo-lyase n=1 Tax=Pseudothermotoga sp. TaxID=2033661 RepID=UPI0031F63D29